MSLLNILAQPHLDRRVAIGPLVFNRPSEEGPQSFQAKVGRGRLADEFVAESANMLRLHAGERKCENLLRQPVQHSAPPLLGADIELLELLACEIGAAE